MTIRSLQLLSDRYLQIRENAYKVHLIAIYKIMKVHRAILTSGDRVAIKVQYPGVAESIESDLTNLKRLVTYTNILPRGLYIDEIIRYVIEHTFY